MVGNGQCNSYTLNANCDYDGGDCDGKNYFLALISNILLMKSSSFTKILGCDIHFIGDGYCDDETNIGECDYDGWDCCATDGPELQFVYCVECECKGSPIISIIPLWFIDFKYW